MTHGLVLAQIESRLQRALERVRVVLDSAKVPCFAGDVHHQYDDKFWLAERMTNAAAASQLNCLSALGLSTEHVSQIREWAKTSAVSLRLRSEERCTFLREESRDIEDPTHSIQELSIGGVLRSAVTSKSVIKVTEYLWKLEVTYELVAVRGVGAQPADHIYILTRTSQDVLKTTTAYPPRPEVKVPAFLDEVNVSWLFRQLSEGAVTPAFTVNRSHDRCHTPRRNPDVEAALSHFAGLWAWAQRSSGYLYGLLQVQPDPSHRLDMGAVTSSMPVVSVLPLFCGGGDTASSEEGIENGQDATAEEIASPTVLACLSSSRRPETGALLSVPDMNQLLAEEARGLAEKRKALAEAFPAGEAVASVVEATLILVLKHCEQVCGQWQDAVNYLEELLQKQLIAAIGKELTPADFAEYMRYHNRKLFADGFLPIPFCYATRRSEVHPPEGTVSIEQEATGAGGDTAAATPIVTMVARSACPRRMQFPINASTDVHFEGDQFLHAWLSHQFSGQSGARLSLVARARQFSSMLVIVGRIASASTFEPKYAAIVQNKDEITVPLDLSTIPTPKEFKDAIESLSPEQQAFAKAFRAMQLESTLFGVIVIQIKPQLEKVLNLPEGSLTKEIKLTQDLMQLFIKYQIPSDLLSFDSGAYPDGFEATTATQAEKLETVKQHVKAMHEMIEHSKEEELAERRMEARHAAPVAQRRRTEDCAVQFSKKLVADKTRVSRCLPAPAAAAASPGAGLPAPARLQAPPRPQQHPPQQAQQQPPQQPPQQQQQQQSPQQQQQPQQPQQPQGAGEPSEEEAADVTQVPQELDRQFERLDADGALRPTIISPGGTWTKRTQKSLLASPTTSKLHGDDQKMEKDAAFDLLDALTKSGALKVEHAALHVVVAATHCFDKTLTETVIQDNANPIDKVERSTLIMASTIHRKPVDLLVRQSQSSRIRATSPMLFVEDGAA